MERSSKKTSLTAYKIFLILFAVSIIIITSLAVIPLLRGGVSIEANPNDVNWEIQNRELIGDTNITIINSAYFDLEDIRLDFEIETKDELSLNMTKKVESISVGESRDVYLMFTKDINDISNSTKKKLINRDTDLMLSIRFQARYTYALMTFDVIYEDAFLWRRLVNEIRYDPEMGKIVDGPSFVFPVHISTNENDFLSGDVEITTSIFGEDNMKKYSEYETIIELGKDISTDFIFNMSEEDSKELMTNSQSLTARTEIALEGSDFSIVETETYRWGAPLADIEISNISYSGDLLTADISFTNENRNRFDFTSRYILYDPNGAEITRTTENHSVGSNSTFQKEVELDTRDEIPEELVVEIEDEETDYLYREVYEF
ncbi:MAG: hypothetical protein ACOCTN_05435 [Candidatus Natronoplasma sp.]